MNATHFDVSLIPITFSSVFGDVRRAIAMSTQQQAASDRSLFVKSRSANSPYTHEFGLEPP